MSSGWLSVSLASRQVEQHGGARLRPEGGLGDRPAAHLHLSLPDEPGSLGPAPPPLPGQFTPCQQDVQPAVSVACQPDLPYSLLPGV